MTHDDFTAALAEVFADLLARQEPLGADFNAAWSENVEELYEE